MANDDPVLTGQRHDVGNGTQRSKSGHLDEEVPGRLVDGSPPSRFPGHGPGQLVGDSRTTESDGETLLIGTVRVHQQDSLGRVHHLMVVGDDHFQPQLLGELDRFRIIAAAVNGDDQVHFLFGKLFHGDFAEAIALSHPMGQAAGHLDSQMTKDLLKNGTATDAIDIVVPKDTDGSSRIANGEDHVDRFLQIGELGRIVKAIPFGIEEGTGLFQCGQTTVDQ